ncbi:4'-phosphopantetheinyl transferase family protein [Rothia sp. P5764]|uniref:4'-phosphopantetheinyl transferase family protein n=1 Tax=Rothia sp. P5764 TaxID=3402654 RepID=UPI003AD3DB9F
MRPFPLKPYRSYHFTRAQVSIYRLDFWCTANHPGLESFWTSLAQAEQEKASRLDLLDPQGCRGKHWALTRILLRLSLCQPLGLSPGQVEISYGPWGKPLCPGASFSLSHSNQWLAIALARQAHTPVGVDLECLATSRAGDWLLPYLHPAEKEELGDLSGAELTERLTWLWTRKEAYLKARGQGLARSLSLDYLGWEYPDQQPPGLDMISIDSGQGPLCSLATLDSCL